MAKLDKIRFAQVVAFIVDAMRTGFDDEAIRSLDNMIDIADPEPQIVPGKADAQMVERLMMFMSGGTQKIEAIREHRAITGMGLKDSKDAVERYWGSSKYTKDVLKNKANLLSHNDTELDVINRFIDEL